MQAIHQLREQFPEPARDLKVNLENVLGASSLSDGQKWGSEADFRFLILDFGLKERQP